MKQIGLQQAIGHLQAGDGRAAADIALAILQQQADNVTAMAIAGAALGQCSEYRQARYWLQQLLQRQPNNLDALINLAQVHRHLHAPQLAIECLQRVLPSQPHNQRARFQLACAYQQSGLPAQARAQLQQLLQINPQHADALAMLADLDLGSGRIEPARHGYQQVLQQQPDHIVARLGQALLDLHTNDAAASHDSMTRLLQRTDLSRHNRAIASHRLGMSAQALGRFPEAYAAFEQSNQLLRELQTTSPEKSSETGAKQASSIYAPAFIRRLSQELQTLADGSCGHNEAIVKPANDSAQDQRKQRVPVFLLGFPRSGTTLLEQMLIAHPLIDSVEENDNLADLHDLLLGSDAPLQAVMQLSPQQQEDYRLAYWQRLDSMLQQNNAEGDQQNAILIDKLPLNSVLLPVIKILFPTAKILFALRDPRAVVFSCWQQMFALNEAMRQFLSLDSSIAYYDLVMQLAALSLEKLPPDCLQVRHEALLQQPSETLQAVLAFLDMPWHEAVLDDSQRGAGRFIDTPSAQQVRQPLHSSGMQRWRHYAKLLPAEFKRLDGWARHWGYAD